MVKNRGHSGSLFFRWWLARLYIVTRLNLTILLSLRNHAFSIVALFLRPRYFQWVTIRKTDSRGDAEKPAAKRENVIGARSEGLRYGMSLTRSREGAKKGRVTPWRDAIEDRCTRIASGFSSRMRSFAASRFRVRLLCVESRTSEEAEGPSGIGGRARSVSAPLREKHPLKNAKNQKFHVAAAH